MDCWSCEISNVTFLQNGLTAYNMVGKSLFCNITIDLKCKRSNSYHCCFGLYLEYKTLLHMSSNHSLLVMDSISINSQGIRSFTIMNTPSIQECIAIKQLQTNYDVTITIKNSHFYNIPHKLMSITADSPAALSTVIIENCLFENITNNKNVIKVDFYGCNKMLKMLNCMFKNNKSLLTLLFVKTTESASSHYNNSTHMNSNSIKIMACKIVNNVGGFLWIPYSFDDSSSKTNVLIAGPIKITGILKTDIMILFYKVNVKFTGKVRILNSHFIPIIMSFLTSDITIDGQIIIDSCTCDRVIYLHSDTTFMMFTQNSSLTITNNFIRSEIICVDQDQFINPYPYCTFQFITTQNVKPLPANYKIVFSNNQISDTREKQCVNPYNHYSAHCLWINTSAFYGYDSTSINEQIIQQYSSQINEHKIVCINSNNMTDCSLDVLGHIYPGQTLQVGLSVPCSGNKATLHVETHHTRLPSSSCKIVNQNQLINFLTSNTSMLNFTIASNATKFCELFLTVSPYLYQQYEAFYAKLWPCPTGFALKNGVCDCDPVLSTSTFIYIKSCNIDQLTINRPENSFIALLSYSNSTYSVCTRCPMDYCLPHSSDLNLQNPDLQCQFNRTGILCSQCQQSLSMVFGSSRCIHCTNTNILISVVILFAGIALVIILYLLNLTVTNGSIIGIIFYANVININDSTFLSNDNIFKQLRVFISFVNLDLGIETCFYNGMDSYAKVFLRLCFPLYIITIAITIILISHYSPRILRWTYAKSFPVLATLLLMSYSGVLSIRYNNTSQIT